MITFDPAKRVRTIEDRGLDFADAAEVFTGRNLTVEDNRFEYGEVRYSTVGMLRGRMVVMDAARRCAPRYFDEEGQ
jgi:uncharacterized DUF497 family protein